LENLGAPADVFNFGPQTTLVNQKFERGPGSRPVVFFLQDQDGQQGSCLTGYVEANRRDSDGFRETDAIAFCIPMVAVTKTLFWSGRVAARVTNALKLEQEREPDCDVPWWTDSLPGFK